jgi:hypothetical protein
MKLPQNPPNADKKWKIVKDKLIHRKTDIDRIVASRKHGFLQGSPLTVDNEFRDMIAIGYAMALEDNNLSTW